jgi:hypothetical protein
VWKKNIEIAKTEIDGRVTGQFMGSFLCSGNVISELQKISVLKLQRYNKVPCRIKRNFGT